MQIENRIKKNEVTGSKVSFIFLKQLVKETGEADGNQTIKGQ